MTELDRVIHEHTARAVLTTISQATERMAEELAREMLKDPTTRTALQTAVRDAFLATVRTLQTTEPKP